MAKKIVLTQSQKNELRELAEAIAASEKAKAIRARFKAFTDDNLEALKEGEATEDLVGFDNRSRQRKTALTAPIGESHGKTSSIRQWKVAGSCSRL